MKSIVIPSSDRARLLCLALLTTLATGLVPSVFAVGPMGLCPGGKNGTSAACIGARAGWVRFGLTLPSGRTTWDSYSFGLVDPDVQNYLNNGVQPIILINNQAYPPSSYPSSWNVNSGGNGDNATIDDWALNYVVPIVAHYKTMGVNYFDMWHEPNANGIHS